MANVIYGQLEAEAARPRPIREMSRWPMHWLHSHSIRVRLYSVFALLFLLVIGLGVVGFVRLSDVNHDSEVIRNHWLRDTRILGDISNYMSDYRAAEATRLLAVTPDQFAASDKEIESLRSTVAQSQRAYEEVVQAPPVAALYGQFVMAWAAYQRVAARVIALARAGKNTDAVVLYNADSRRAFDVSSDVLSRLTDQTVVKAREGSDRAAATYRNARAMLVTSMILATSLLLGVMIYIIRAIMAPLLELVGSMHRLAAHDTQLVIPSIERDDEIGAMARAVAVFRDNAVALVGSQRRLIEQAAALEGGLEQERRLTAQQRDFVSMTSHEFLTPLTIIDAHAQRLIKMSDRLEACDIVERGESIRDAVQRITGIMDSLLGSSQILDGHAVFRPAGIDPGALLRDACQTHRDANRNVLIIEDFSALPPTIYGDSRLLFHAFSNLISNAVKYSPSGGPVEVVARLERDWLVVQVRDCGIGILASDQEHLFERYFRGSNATGIAGAGVGLHLVAMVVKLHQGAVFAESAEGVGSRFTVRLPTWTPKGSGTEISGDAK
jgi:signal transduction histidine kinase